MKKLIIALLLVFILTPAAEANPVDEAVKELVDNTNKGCLSSTMTVITRTGDTENIFKYVALMPNSEVRQDIQLGLLSSQAITQSLKFAVGRTRPRTGQDQLKPFSGHKSFPSGHATGAFAIATAIAENYPDYKIYAYGWATLVAVSRMYEDAHYFTDIVAGSAIGHYTTKYAMNLSFEWRF